MSEWRPVPDWEGFYEVTAEGRIRSLSRVVRSAYNSRTYKNGKELQPVAHPRFGYLTVGLSRDGQATRRAVHSLVAETFIGPRPNGAEVCHIDGNPANNGLENLRYGTHAENEADKRRHGTSWPATRTHCVNGHQYTEESTAYSLRDGARVCRNCSRAASQRYRKGRQLQ